VIWERTGRVEIYDTDASGLIFYGAPTQWFAVAEQELYDALDIRWPLGESELGVATTHRGASSPTRSYEIHLDGPLRFRERYLHEVWISAVGRTSFAMSHEISVEGDVRIRGVVRRVYVTVGDDGSMVPTVVPQVFRDAVVDRDSVPR
jgi:acyl-CoA thioesterase FadM